MAACPARWAARCGAPPSPLGNAGTGEPQRPGSLSCVLGERRHKERKRRAINGCVCGDRPDSVFNVRAGCLQHQHKQTKVKFFFFFCACVHTPAGMKHPQGIPCLEFCSELLTYVNQILDAPPGCFLHLGCFCFSLPFLETVPLFDCISVALFCQLFKAFICRMSAKFRCCMQS